MGYSKIVAALLVVFFLASCTGEKSTGKPYAALPDQAVAVVKVNDVKQAAATFSQSHIYQSLRVLPFFQNLESRLTNYRQFFLTTQDYPFLSNRDFYGALALSGAKQYQMLWTTPVHKSFQSQLVEPFLRGEKHRRYLYSQVEVIELTGRESKHLFIAVTQDLLLFSESKNLLEQAIRQVQAQYNFLHKAPFKALHSTANQKDPLNLYIEYAGFEKFLDTQLPPGTANFMSNLAGWGEWDVQASKQEMILSGISHFEAGKGHFWQTFQNIEAQEISATAIFPTQLALSLSYTFQNYGQYQRAFQQMLAQRNRLALHLKKLKALQHPDSVFLQYIDNEIGLFYNGTGSGGTEPVAYVKLREVAEPEKFGEALSDTNFIEGYRAHIIRQMAQDDMLPAVFGRIFKDFKRPYVTRLDDFWLFSDNQAALKSVISDYLDGKTLAQSEAFANFYSSMPQEAHIQVLASNPQALALVPQVLRSDAAATLQEHRSTLSNIHWAGMQVHVSNKAAFTSLYFKETERTKPKLARRWTTQLENAPRGEPQFLKNHRTGKYDVAIQDEKNQLYLLDHSGNVFWNASLNGPILGSISQVDLFQNGKLQMAFNTAQSLYVIDRLGRPVKPFPVRLPQEATAPAGIFDYDGVRKYRFVVPCGKMLYNYNGQGKETPGWKFAEAESALVSKPQFFSVKNRDIIVCLTAKGKVYQLNRRGEERFELPDRIEELKTRFFMKPGTSLKKSELLANSTSGRIYVLSPYSKIDTIQLEKGRPADYFLYFNNSYIFSSDEALFIKNDKHPFSVEFQGDISALPKALLYQNRFYVGAYSAAAEEIRVYNGQGNLLSGFPVFAQGPFDMGSLLRNGMLDVVTYSSDGTVVCYTVE